MRVISDVAKTGRQPRLLLISFRKWRDFANWKGLLTFVLEVRIDEEQVLGTVVDGCFR
jgi:hypothetical protein